MESSQLDVRMRRCGQQLAALCLAASAAIGSTLLSPNSAAIAAEPEAESSGFLLPPVLGAATLELDADPFLVPAQRKFIRLSKMLVSLPDDDAQADDSVDNADEANADEANADQDQRRSRLRRLRIDLDEENAAEEDAEDRYAEDADEDADEGMSASLTSLRISQDDRGRFKLPTLAAPSTSTAKIGNGKTPEGFRGEVATPAVPLAESGDARQLDSGPWAWSVGRWSAANTYSHPRYFEDRMLERHGHERFPALQPMASGLRFFATVPMMPYLMTLSHPCDCESTLGYYRSGSCAPILHQQPPWDREAALVEAAAVASVIAIFP